MADNNGWLHHTRTAVARWRLERGSFAPFTAARLVPLVSERASTATAGARVTLAINIALALTVLHRRSEIIRLRLTEQGSEYVAGLQTAPLGHRALASCAAANLYHPAQERKASVTDLFQSSGD